MNPLFDNFALHRVVLSFDQKDYRNEIHVLYGSPGLNRKDWLGLAGHQQMVPLERRTVLNVTNQVKQKLDEKVLCCWEEIEKIVKLVEHPHSEDIQEGKISEDGVYYEDGKRYHVLRPGPVNSSTWAVLVSRKVDPEDSSGNSQVEEYSVTQTPLAPRA
ncbi:hypothetical protein FO519_005727 [Halicephalobus sp. NKZ332]|nr:hypothetical protein FO519_005727 [Halicephalobus sp. NKZ332]